MSTVPQRGPNAVLDSAVEMTVRLQQIAETLQREVTRLGFGRSEHGADHQLTQLKDELRDMARLIAETRSEVVGLLPPGVAGSRLSSASGELDAVVGATERAAVEIMGAAERAQEAAQRLRAAGASERDVDVIEAAATDIFMACSFQDLTGQRIRKVVQALTYIEQRVNSLSALWQDQPDLDMSAAPAVDTRADAHLLNGPDTAGLAQDDIDALLGNEAKPAASSQDDIDALFA
jgi:chemotaxis regulatin CheY-phosphate phosphatase CheZ